MKPGFQKQSIAVKTSDGLNDVLLESLPYLAKDGTLYQCPRGGTTDGISDGWAFQWFAPATGDASWLCGVLHDSGYRNQLEKWFPISKVWDTAELSRLECDELILEALELQGIGLIKRQIIYRALRAFGASAFNNDRLKF